MKEKAEMLLMSAGIGALMFGVLAIVVRWLRFALVGSLPALVVVLVASVPVSAQSAPDRSGDVARIVSQHPEAFRGDSATVDDRKRALLPVIVRELNVQDGGRWGLLTKTDQGGKVPADVIVWRPTLEHFDVLTDRGPMWGPHGPLQNPAWLWTAVSGSPEPPSGPADTPVPSVDLAPLLARLQALEQAVQALSSTVPPLAQQVNAHGAELERLALAGERLDVLTSRVDMLAALLAQLGCRASVNLGFGRVPVGCAVTGASENK